MSAFDDFASYLALDRVGELALSPDGSRLVASVCSLNEKGDAFATALWEIDPDGVAEPRRLTTSEEGEASPEFAADGTLLFTSKRGGADDDPPALWRLPAGSGEASRVLTRPGGVTKVVAARSGEAIALATPVLPGSSGAEEDAKRRSARKDAKTGAVLHTGSLVRYWDHDLGPDETHLHLLSADGTDPADLTPEPGRALDEAGFALTPDGRTLVTGWLRMRDAGMPVGSVVAIDTATGERRVLAADEDASFGDPAVSRDGRYVVCTRERLTDYDNPPGHSLWLVGIDGGVGRELIADPDVWPAEPQFSPDGSFVYFLADADGHRPIFRLDLANEAITRLTPDGHYTNLRVAEDGTLFALRDHIDSPPAPVRVGADGTVTRLRAPGSVEMPGHVERVETQVEDGTRVHGWLALPDAPGPHPLLLWVHGGPLMSWNGWSWRWNPWLMVARGYAVLLPDPALSSGYGEHMVRRGWGQWGGTPYTDLMTITDAVEARSDIDETRTAAMGGSYGGYMANWIAGHTDRFRTVVTHASLWALDGFQATTDIPGYWIREWGLPAERPERYAQWSPHRFASAITTPMLVIHGDKDYRVPIGEALQLWTDLQRAGVESKYLYFPDEGHWVLAPANARIWYETVWAWLAQHVLGEDWQQPELL